MSFKAALHLVEICIKPRWSIIQDKITIDQTEDFSFCVKVNVYRLKTV